MTRLFIYFMLACLLCSCGSKTETAEGTSGDTNPLSQMNKDDWTFSGKAFGIFHEVKDFELWKNAFDADAPRRDSVGFQFLSILRSVDDSNNIAVFFMTPDHQVAKDFISDDLRTKMDEAGVSSVPSFIMYNIVYLTSKDFSNVPYRIAASYKVKNYQSWLDKYVNNADERKRTGMIDIAVARSPESPRMVYIMTASNTLEDGRAFIDNETSTAKMQEYEIVGEPTFSLWKRADFVE